MTKRIRSKLPKNVQTLFFSATWTDAIKKFAKTLAALSDNDWSQVSIGVLAAIVTPGRACVQGAGREREACAFPRCHHPHPHSASLPLIA